METNTKEKNSYDKLSDEDKLHFLTDLYTNQELGWSEVAKKLGTYTNKVIRDGKRLGITSRTRSEAQAIAIASGRHPHPTKDKGHSESAKVKISETVAKQWAEMPEEKREEKRKIAKERWEEKTPEEIKEFRQAAGDGVRKAAKVGSKLELFLLEGLISAGYKVDFHKEHWVVREQLQIDLFIPELLIAIEVDGPSHFQDIWGSDALAKNQQRDAEKSGLLLERGCVILRVRQTKPLSEKYKRDLLGELLTALEKIKTTFPPKGQRIIVIGENNG